MGHALPALREPAGAPAGNTIPTVFWEGVRTRGPAIMMREKDLGIWRATTWAAAGEIVRSAGLGLVSLGLQPGDCACILSNNNKEWVCADLGILGAAGVSAGVYPTDASTQVEYLLNDSGSKYIFVEDEEQLDKVLEIREHVPALHKIVVFDMEGLHDFQDPMVLSFDALLARGRAYHAAHPDEWERLLAVPEPAQLAILIYTSGTTGPPKGAMISHHNVVFQCREMAKMLPQSVTDERMSFLPMCHVAERVGGFYFSMYTGTVMNFVENPDTVLENIQEIRPTVFVAVPRIWEKFYSRISIALSEATLLQRQCYGLAIGIGYRRADFRLRGRMAPWLLRALGWAANLLVLNNIRRMVGIDRCRWMVTGAAPISPDLIRWYLALGLNMYEAYGQTENTGLATMMPADRIKQGTVGKCVPYGELSVSPEGEILLRGEHIFMGYFNNPEKTAETVRGGWLYTGDVGLIDDEGFVKIHDRMKDIIITSGGKNITPSEIENQLKFSPYITDAVVIGDRRKFLTSLIMIDFDNVVLYAQTHDVPFTNFTSLCRAPQVLELIRNEIEKVNRKFAQVETIKEFRLIEQELTPEDDELTPTMKLKRKFVNEKYRELIDSMYTS